MQRCRFPCDIKGSVPLFQHKVHHQHSLHLCVSFSFCGNSLTSRRKRASLPKKSPISGNRWKRSRVSSDKDKKDVVVFRLPTFSVSAREQRKEKKKLLLPQSLDFRHTQYTAASPTASPLFSPPQPSNPGLLLWLRPG